jgi:hypothetical protein
MDTTPLLPSDSVSQISITPLLSTSWKTDIQPPELKGDDWLVKDLIHLANLVLTIVTLVISIYKLK